MKSVTENAQVFSQRTIRMTISLGSKSEKELLVRQQLIIPIISTVSQVEMLFDLFMSCQATLHLSDNSLRTSLHKVSTWSFPSEVNLIQVFEP